MFVITYETSNFPDFQYVVLSSKKKSTIKEGSVISGKYQTENMKNLNKLHCFSSLMTEDKIDDDCLHSGSFKPYPELDLYFEGFTALVVKIVLEDAAIQFLCPFNSDVIHSLGILIVSISSPAQAIVFLASFLF